MLRSERGHWIKKMCVEYFSPRASLVDAKRKARVIHLHLPTMAAGAGEFRQICVPLDLARLSVLPRIGEAARLPIRSCDDGEERVGRGSPDLRAAGSRAAQRAPPHRRGRTSSHTLV
jgi:hypothetical protein